jgi:type IV secretory pathway TrbL component
MYAHTCDVFILILYVCLNTEDNQDFIEIIESFCLFVVVTTIIFIYAHNLSVPKHQTLFMFGVEQADEFRK